MTIADADVDVEIAKGRERYAGDPKLTKYFESDRGRSYIRSTLRRSRVVEKLVDDGLAAHPDHPAIPHVEDGPADTMDEDQARSVAAVGATDPGSILDADALDRHHDHDHDHAHHDHGDHDHMNDRDRETTDDPAPAG
jgi:hypothetical protein